MPKADRRAARPGASTRPREFDVLRQVVEAAAMFGVHLERRNVGMATGASGKPVRFGKPGESDLYGHLPTPDHRAIFVEVKRPGRKPTPEQLDFLNRANARGDIGLWCDDPRQIAETLPKLLRGWRIEIDGMGYPWRVSDDEPAAPAEGGE
jgi:hypothetical protein